MLKEYFNIIIDIQTGSLLALPVIIEGYFPVPEELPEFLLRLATDTIWDNESQCFQTIAYKSRAKY
jgi:hypothetical protein